MQCFYDSAFLEGILELTNFDLNRAIHIVVTVPVGSLVVGVDVEHDLLCRVVRDGDLDSLERRVNLTRDERTHLPLEPRHLPGARF